MITDITGTELIPGNCGLNCPGNGFQEEHPCCCDECDYMMCCLIILTRVSCAAI